MACLGYALDCTWRTAVPLPSSVTQIRVKILTDISGTPVVPLTIITNLHHCCLDISHPVHAILNVHILPTA